MKFTSLLPSPEQGIVRSQKSSKLKPILRVDSLSLKSENKGIGVIKGSMKIVNTIEEFKTIDKMELLNASCTTLWEDIRSGRAAKDTSLLAPFLLLTFADLKRHVFLYWFAFPSIAPNISEAFKITNNPTSYSGDSEKLATSLATIGFPFAFVLKTKDQSIHRF